MRDHEISFMKQYKNNSGYQRGGEGGGNPEGEDAKVQFGEKPLGQNDELGSTGEVGNYWAVWKANRCTAKMVRTYLFKDGGRGE